MNLLKHKSRMLILIFSLVSITAVGQTKTDFSGKWMLQDSQNISGTVYSNAVPKEMKVVQKDKSITIEKITASTDSDIVTTELLDFNGKPFETITPSKRKKLISLDWHRDQKGFNVIANLYNPNDQKSIDIKISDTWSMKDGKLIMTRKSENFVNGEVWECRASYTKQ